MPELDEMWNEVLREAKERAANTGRRDVVEYLRLREANDAARNVGIEWLFATFLEVAVEANRRGLSLATERSSPHSFAVGGATMQGEKIRLSFGVRALNVEAGFPRTPADGFVRGGGLAAARITHFGMAKANADLLLVRANSNSKEAPVWLTIDDQNLRRQFSTADLKIISPSSLGKFSFSTICRAGLTIWFVAYRAAAKQSCKLLILFLRSVVFAKRHKLCSVARRKIRRIKNRHNRQLDNF